MILRLLRWPFGFVRFVVTLVFVGVIFELVGFSLYLQWANEAALAHLLAGGVGPMEAVAFVLASPDRMLVAGVLAVVSVWFVRAGGSGRRSHTHGGGGGGDNGGGFGGFGGGGDGGGGGGGE